MDKSYVKFQQNLKKTSFGVRFGKELFTNPEKFNAKNIAQIFKMLGVPIPKEVQITAEAAQLIVAGGSLVDAVSDYQEISDAENLQAIAQCSADSFQAVGSLVKTLGWADETTTSELVVATSACRIFASGGMDVQAWISLGVELSVSGAKNQINADMLARRGAIQYYQGMVSRESESISKHLSDMNSGKTGLFGFIAGVGMDAPSLFNDSIIKNQNLVNLLPGLKFIPVFDSAVISQASSTTWYNRTDTSSFSISFKTIADIKDPKLAKEYLFAYVIEPYTYNYLEADYYYRSQGKASIFNAATLAIVNNEGYLERGKDFSKMFLQNQLVPSDVGDLDTFNNFSENVEDPFMILPGVKISNDQNLTQKQALDLQARGNVIQLFKSRSVTDTLTRRYTFDYFPEVQTMAKIDWREIQNFVACLDYLDLVRNDPFYSSGAKIDRIEQYSGFSKADKWKATTKDAINKSMLRLVNLNSRNNVAYFLQTSSNKLKMKQDYKPGQPAKFY